MRKELIKQASLVLVVTGLVFAALSIAAQQKIADSLRSNNRNASRKTETVKLSQSQIREAYGKLPLSFEANQGQTDSRVKFLSRGSSYTLFLRSAEAVLALSKPAA